jgi:Flp pilus assembly pilin Flp
MSLHRQNDVRHQPQGSSATAGCGLSAGVRSSLRRWFDDDRGHDLIEYALLAAFVALAGLVGFQLLGSAMNTTFGQWNSAVESQWEPSAPAGS